MNFFRYAACFAGLFFARTFAILLCASLIVCFLARGSLRGFQFFVVFVSSWSSLLQCPCAFRRGSLRVLFFRGLCLGKSRVCCVLQFGHSRSFMCFMFSCVLLVLLTVGFSCASCVLCVLLVGLVGFLWASWASFASHDLLCVLLVLWSSPVCLVSWVSW